MWYIRLGSTASLSCVIPEMTDQGYFYTRIPNGRGYKKIWINRAAVEQKKNRDGVKYAVADWLNYRITEKGNIVLLPRDDMDATVVILHGECGYRGDSSLTGDFETIYRGAYYHSPRGALGIDDVHLAVVRDGTIINLIRTGRTYGNPKKVTFKVVFGGDGIEVIIADEEDDEELKKLL